MRPLLRIMAHHESVYVSELLKKESVSNFSLMEDILEDGPYDTESLVDGIQFGFNNFSISKSDLDKIDEQVRLRRMCVTFQTMAIFIFFRNRLKNI